MTEMCIEAANHIVRKTNEYNQGRAYSERISMTCKRLQKLLYFSDIQFMKQNNGESMFTDDFYAWPSGPVIPAVYDEFMQYQDGEMSPVGGEHSPLTEQNRKAIDDIFEKTIDIDTYDLVKMSHIEGGPWQQVYDETDINHEQIISKQEMFNFYRDRDVLLLI